jgi:DNA-binding SARP family transcriptional activator
MSTQGVRVINYTILGRVTACQGSWTADLSPQQQLLLAILVMERGAPVSRAGLARALWDEEDPPEGGLKRVVSELRTQLRVALPDSDPLPARGNTYCLPLSEQQADVLRFRSKIDQAVRATGQNATQLMREALREWGGNTTGLFGGQPLTGLRGRWADSTREKLRAEYRDARLRCVRQDFDSHQYDRVAAECRQLANEPDALHDELFLMLWMIATYRAGHRTEAEQIYQRAVESAKAHLGSELSGQTRKLAEIIRDEDHSKLDGPADLLDLASGTLSRGSTDRQGSMSDAAVTFSSPDNAGAGVQAEEAAGPSAIDMGPCSLEPCPRAAQDSQEEGPDGAGEGPHDNTHADEVGKPEAARGPGDPQPAVRTGGGHPESHTTINASGNSTVFNGQVMSFGAFHFHGRPSTPGEENEAS